MLWSEVTEVVQDEGPDAMDTGEYTLKKQLVRFTSFYNRNVQAGALRQVKANLTQKN